MGFGKVAGAERRKIAENFLTKRTLQNVKVNFIKVCAQNQDSRENSWPSLVYRGPKKGHLN